MKQKQKQTKQTISKQKKCQKQSEENTHKTGL